MKVIPIVGYSGAGKTTFALKLVERLKELGSVGTVKHLGHHRFHLEAEKDTTQYFEKGAMVSIGVDMEKSVVIARENHLEAALDLLADQGTQFALVEGFKTSRFPKIVIGDLPDENCILRNPGVEDVISRLSSFADHYTMNGVVKELKRECRLERAGVIMTINGIVREWTGDVRTDYVDFEDDIDWKIQQIKQRMERIEGILGVKFYHRKGRLHAGEDITFIAIIAEHRKEAFLAAGQALEELKKSLHAALPGYTP